jgi:hypothetical protein
VADSRNSIGVDAGELIAVRVWNILLVAGNPFGGPIGSQLRVTNHDADVFLERPFDLVAKSL